MLKETPPIESPTVTLPRQEYNQVIEKMKQFGELQEELLKTVTELNGLKMTTSTIVLPNGVYLDYRSNSVTIPMIMDGLALVLRHNRYNHIKDDLLKIAKGLK